MILQIYIQILPLTLVCLNTMYPTIHRFIHLNLQIINRCTFRKTLKTLSCKAFRKPLFYSSLPPLKPFYIFYPHSLGFFNAFLVILGFSYQPLHLCYYPISSLPFLSINSIKTPLVLFG